jgi:hypothetical protein
MWNVQEARLRAEVLYRQEQLLQAAANERRVRQVVRQLAPPYGSPGLPSWRRWSALLRLALTPAGPGAAREQAGRRPRVQGVEGGRQAG